MNGGARMDYRRGKIMLLWYVIMSSAGCSQKAVTPNNNSASHETAGSPQEISWKQLGDGSFVAAYDIGAVDETTTKRCWKVEGGFDCILVSGDGAQPSGWWADRQQAIELEATNEDQRNGYTCYGGGKREPGVTIGEVVSADGETLDNNYVKMPSRLPWSREHIEATVVTGGENEYFDCPALDRFFTRHGVAALGQEIEVPKLF